MSYIAEIQVRFRDLDPMEHVNNALYVTYLEQARAMFYEEVVEVTLADIDTVLAQLEVSYEQAIEEVGTVTVELTVGELGNSSIPMEYEIHSSGQRVATGQTVQVYVDSETGKPKRIPDQHRGQLRRGQ